MTFDLKCKKCCWRLTSRIYISLVVYFPLHIKMLIEKKNSWMPFFTSWVRKKTSEWSCCRELRRCHWDFLCVLLKLLLFWSKCMTAFKPYRVSNFISLNSNVWRVCIFHDRQLPTCRMTHIFFVNYFFCSIQLSHFDWVQFPIHDLDLQTGV